MSDCRFGVSPVNYPDPDFIDFLDDNNLIQLVSESTRQDNILDLFLTSNDLSI